MASTDGDVLLTEGVDTLLWNATTEMKPASGVMEVQLHIRERIIITIITIIGALVNLATMFILKNASSSFAAGYLLLLQNQALLDFMVCVCSSVIILQKPMWTTGNYIVDSIVCHVWHGQAFYWGWVLTSIWNLVMVAFERLLAICYPFKHVDLTIGRVKQLILIAFAVGWLSLILSFLQVRLGDDGVCVSEYLIRGKIGEWVFFVHGQYIFFIYWLLPFILFSILYGKVLMTLFTRRDNSNLGESTLVNTATAQMTRTAITVTIIFILSMSWDIWYYMLGRVGLVIYIKNTILQMIGLWLSTFNSVANPFVYFVLLPAFRKATFTTLLPCIKFGPPAAGKKRDTNTNTA